MKKILLNMIAIASTCCCLFKGAKNISNKKVLENQNNTYLEAEKLDAKFPIEKEIGKEIDPEPIRGLTDPAEYPQYVQNEFDNDKISGAQTVDPKWGEITGTINTHSGWDQFWFGIGSIDQDWYKFQTKENRKYRIDFDTPSTTNGYVLTIYKAWKEGLKETDLKAIKTLKGDRSVTVNINETGTFYFKVTVSSKDYIVKNGYYKILYNDIKEETSFSLSDSNKAAYKMAVWENDFIPSNVNRWSNSNKQSFYSYYSDGTNTRVSGQNDYLFHVTGGERILDSVLYIWGNEELNIVLEILEIIDEKVKKDFKNQQILSGFVSLGNDGTSLGLTIVGSAIQKSYPAIAKFLGGVGVVITVLSIANGLLKMLFPDNSLNKLQSFIDILSTSCHWVSTHNITDAVICIPRYTYYSFETTNNGRSGGGSTQFWNFTYVEDDDTYRPYYDFSDSSITSYQTYKNGTKTYHGKITSFATGADFLNFFGLDISDYVDLNSYIFAEEHYISDEPLYEKQLSFDSSNNFTQYTKVKFQNAGDALFFTRGNLNTKIELYDETMSTRYTFNQGDGYDGNGMFSYYLQANKSYIVKTTAIPSCQEMIGWACLDIIRAVTYKNNYQFTSPTYYSDIAQIIGGPFEGFLEFATDRSTIVLFTPEYTGKYLISTHYNHYYHLIPMSLGSYNSYESDHKVGIGTLDADYVNLEANVPCLIVVARTDRFAEVPASGALHSFGMLIDLRSYDNENEWDCEGNTYYYLEPSNLTYHGGSNPYYELNEIVYIDVEPWHMASLKYLGLYDYTNADFFYQSVTPLNDGTSGVRIVFRTHNVNAQGEMYIRYSWHHVSYEDPNL